MKKAQILSAIALAFALGVVAPVAGVYAVDNGAARVATGETAEKVATNDNLKSAVNYVTSNAAYKAFATLAEADEAAVVSGGSATVKETVGTGSANAAVVAALGNFAGSTVTSGDTITALESNVANLKTAVGSDYTKYVALYDAVNADVTKIGSAAAMEAVASAMRDLGYKFEIEDGDTFGSATTDGSVVKEAKDLIDNNTDVSSYSNYMGAVEAVKAAEDSLKAFGDLKTALENAKLNLTKAQANSVASAETIAVLKTVVIGVAGADDWADVATKITAIETAIKNENSTTNAARYALLDNETVGSEGLLQLMRVATGDEDLTYAQLISATPTTPETPDDTTTTTIESADGSVSVKGELQAGLVVEAKEAEEKDEMFKKAFGDKKFFVYDIKIKGQNGYVTTFDKDVTVTVKVPENINGAKAGIYYINDEGSASKIASTYNAEAKTLTFTTNHFSYYAIVEDNGVNVSDSGVLAAADGTASSTVAIVAGIATALTAAGAGVVAYRNARRASKEA